MSELTLSLLALIATAHVNAAFALSSQITVKPDADIEAYFCETNQPGLATVAQAREWFSFLASGRPAEIMGSGLDGKPCSGTMQRMVLDGIWNADGPVALSQIVSLAGFLQSPPDEPEKRLAYDTEMLGWIVLACSTFEGEEQPCVSRAIRDLPSQTLGESPVFCSFSASASPDELKSRYGEYAETASFSMCPAIAGIPDAQLSDGDEWWSRVQVALAPFLEGDGAER